MVQARCVIQGSRKPESLMRRANGGCFAEPAAPVEFLGKILKNKCAAGAAGSTAAFYGPQKT